METIAVFLEVETVMLKSKLVLYTVMRKKQSKAEK
jgi:hypothetical protein